MVKPWHNGHRSVLKYLTDFVAIMNGIIFFVEFLTSYC